MGDAISVRIDLGNIEVAIIPSTEIEYIYRIGTTVEIVEELNGDITT